MEEISVKTIRRIQLIDVTAKVQEAVSKSKIKDGVCIVYCPHTTAAVVITENADPSVQNDLLEKLSGLVQENAGYSHSEGNSDAHIKSAVIGNSRTILVQSGRLVLGTWESIFFAEFDGPRQRKLLVSVK